ncbi:MAG: glycosyltransferase family 2 protein [Cohaesibacter sp.]|jgi:glycosyltransferase involved in cell wall biosynthesis|nr:glycosyltransferase family 2 protein [Cohaesibacter sp.]
MSQIHTFILTFNEEKHLARCVESLSGQCASVTVIDSGSSDKTLEIARDLGCRILANDWVNHAAQVNFAIDALSDEEGWLFRIDADEVLDKDSIQTLMEAVEAAPDGCDGLVVARRLYFMGRRMRHGAIEPSWQLRLFRASKGRCEQRWMDEHILVEGEVGRCGIVISDKNLNPLTWWTQKHNKYASLEAIEVLNSIHHFMPVEEFEDGQASSQAKVKRFIKLNIYLKLPSGVRAGLYFLYRYMLRLGFLDGKEGFYFHLLQGLWYRSLVDAKVLEIADYSKEQNISILEAIRICTGIDVRS